MSALEEREPAAPDLDAVLPAVAICLRHLACGYGLLQAERAACLSLLQSRVPGVLAADLAAAMKVLASTRHLTARQRHEASELSVRFAEMGASRRG